MMIHSEEALSVAPPRHTPTAVTLCGHENCISSLRPIPLMQMSRPGSRGGLATPNAGGTSLGAAPFVPGTASGLRPGTMMRGAVGLPPGTAARLRTGAIQSTPGTQAAMGVALATEVQVADRPVTQQGMRGMKTGQLGPGRQVADPSFYIGVLRAKVNEITGEVRKLSGEAEQYQKDAGQFSQLERKYDSMLKEVRTLEGTLADYNLAMDKLRTSTDPDEVRQYQKQVEATNKREAQEIDRVFLMKQQREKETAEMEGQIVQLQRQAEEKINNLEPRRLQLYKDLVARTNNLQAEAQAQQGAIEAAVARLRQWSEAQTGPSYNDQYNVLEKKITRLQREKTDQDEDMAISQMDSKEAHQKLLAKVKEDNRQGTELEQRCKSLKEEIASKRRHLAELASDGGKGDSGDSQKYEVLYKRDQEMTEFIDKFDEAKAAILSDQQRVQETIVALLTHVSQGLEVENQLPSEQRFKEMKDEVSFKEKQLESSHMTMTRLVEEKNKRTQEFEKINGLDEKIAVELTAIQCKIESMQKEMGEFEDIEGLKTRADGTQRYLTEARKNYIRRRDSVKQQVQLLSSAYDAKKKSLTGNEVATALDSLEQKLRHYEQSIFTMKEYIESKMRETDYQGVKDECLRFTAQLNMLHRQVIEEPSMKAYAGL